jgi:hypothetical protein
MCHPLVQKECVLSISTEGVYVPSMSTEGVYVLSISTEGVYVLYISTEGVPRYMCYPLV